MRLWHADLIMYLPRQQLLGQWRECVLIAKSLAEKGTPNHVLVNKVTRYNRWHFRLYCELVRLEMECRGYPPKKESVDKLHGYLEAWRPCFEGIPAEQLFEGWHNRRYLDQCFFNLQEKHDCGAIPDDEFERLYIGYETILKAT